MTDVFDVVCGMCIVRRWVAVVLLMSVLAAVRGSDKDFREVESSMRTSLLLAM